MKMPNYNSWYYKTYWKNIRKLLLEKKKKFAVFGHLHTPHRENDFVVIGSYRYGNIYEDSSVVAISDVHIGNFDYSEQEMKAIYTILGRSDKKVLLTGDFFDLFYDKPDNLKRRFADLIDYIKQRQADGELVYIRGNHDFNVDEVLGIETVAEYSNGDIIYVHGDKQDPFYTIFPFTLWQAIRSRLGYRLRFLRSIYLNYFS